MKKNIFKSIVATASLFLCLTAERLIAESFDVVANESVKVESLDKAALKDILLGKTAYWDGGQAVTVIIVTEKTDAALLEITGMSASQFKTHWQRLTFSGRGKQPKETDSPEKLASLVASTKGAVALIPAGTPLQSAKKIDLK